MGIFAAASISKGTRIWTLNEQFDRLLSDDDILALPPAQREFVDRYGYPHTTKPGLTIVEIDNGRFMNHSDDPNTDFRNPEFGFAIRDIAEGEEITCDYEQFAPGTEMLPGRFFVDSGIGPAALSA